MVQCAFGRYAGAVKVTFRFNRPGSVAAWIWNCGKGLWALSLPALIVLKLTGVIDWSWWWVVLSPLWLSGGVATFRFNLPGSVGVWIWNRGQDLWVLSLPAFIVLKLTGVITWSWWWALSPLWISGILLAPVLCVLLVFLGLHMFRRAASSEELAAERYGMELRELGGDDDVGTEATAPAPAAARRVRQRGGAVPRRPPLTDRTTAGSAGGPHPGTSPSHPPAPVTTSTAPSRFSPSHGAPRRGTAPVQGAPQGRPPRPKPAAPPRPPAPAPMALTKWCVVAVRAVHGPTRSVRAQGTT